MKTKPMQSKRAHPKSLAGSYDSWPWRASFSKVAVRSMIFFVNGTSIPWCWAGTRAWVHEYVKLFGSGIHGWLCLQHNRNKTQVREKIFWYTMTRNFYTQNMYIHTMRVYVVTIPSLFSTNMQRSVDYSHGVDCICLLVFYCVIHCVADQVQGYSWSVLGAVESRAWLGWHGFMCCA